MLPEHFTQEEWDKESEYLSKCQPTTKTGGTGFNEMMTPYFEWLEKQGEPLPIPTHSFDLMKEHRQKTYLHKLSEYEVSRNNNGFDHASDDIARFRLSWLEKELHVVEGWLAYTSLQVQKGRPEVDVESDKAEQTKYKQDIEFEIKAGQAQIKNQSAFPPTVTDEQILTQSQRALYWFYLHDTGSRPAFTKYSSGKVEAIKELVGNKSYKNFQLHYNRFHSYEYRTSRENITRIEAILPLLVKYQKAYSKAMDELKVAKNK